MSNFTELHLTHKIFRILPVFSQSLWNLTIIFSGSLENFLWCYNRWLTTSLAPEKFKKRMQYAFKLFWYKVFVHSKLKLLNFLVDSVLMIEMSQINVFCRIQLPKRLYWFAYGRPSLVFAFASLISCVEKWQECPIIAQKVLRASFVRAKDPFFFFKENNRDP